MAVAPLHVPVMPREAAASLLAHEGGWFVDCTLGMGGHSATILGASPDARVLGVDRDPDAVSLARAALGPFGDRFRSVRSDFKDVGAWEHELPESPRGILIDLGLSTYQLKAGRGFSFRDEGALDMRMDPGSGTSAASFLARVGEEELVMVLRSFGEERQARRIARVILKAREEAPIADAARLAAIVEGTVPAFKRGPIHPATRTFQALRILVNRELEGLGAFLEKAVLMLPKGGRIVVLAYHSLEDRIVKETFRTLARGCICPPRLPACACGRAPSLRLVSKKAMRPSPAEVAANPSSRSARMRVAERL
jgi:16S rRNA (cytosine1402-N4)-methyltransferase